MKYAICILTLLTSFGTGVAAAAAPEIALSATSLSFGYITEGQSGSQSFSVSNTGNADLSVGISSSEGQFTLSPSSFTVGAGSSTAVAVTFTPNVTGARSGTLRSATLTISSNDSDEGSLTVSVWGTGIAAAAPVVVTPVAAPNISVSTDILIFGDVSVGSSTTATVTISNTGNAPLSIGGVSTTRPQFSVSSGSFTIGAGSSQNLIVTFGPTAEGGLIGGLSIESNDPDQPTSSVSLSGTGTVAPVANISVSRNSDFDGSGTVDFADFLIFASVFGTSHAQCDLDGSGTVDFADFLTFASVFGQSVSSTIITFEDANLEAVVRNSINKPEGDILSTDVSELTQLDASDKNISSLSGIETLTALTILDLDSNPISDISPLSGLTALKSLGLGSNQISDLSPLSSLTAPTVLVVTNNPLNTDALHKQIPALQARGVTILN